jgi:CRP/FNR family transcriptional regulator, cyclic AMP receptor protein
VAEAKSFQPGEYIFKEGDEDSNFYIVKEGQIAISIKTNDGGERIIAYIRKGELLGEGTLNGKTKKPAGAKAVTPVKMLALSKEKFDAFSASNPAGSIEFLLSILAMVNGRLNKTNIKMKALFEISKNIQQNQDNLTGLCTAMIQQLLGLTESHDGAVILKNPITETYRSAYSTSSDLGETLAKDIDLGTSQLKTAKSGELLIANLKNLGAVILRRMPASEPYDEDSLHLVQLIAEVAASNIEDASKKAEEKAKNILHQQRVAL